MMLKWKPCSFRGRGIETAIINVSFTEMLPKFLHPSTCHFANDEEINCPPLTSVLR